MSRPTWDETWIEVARAVAKRSLCSRDQVGAVIVDPSNRFPIVGYNGPPAGFDTMDGISCVHWCSRANQSAPSILATDYSDCPSLHAEINSISVSSRETREGGTIYVTSHICFNCSKAIANSGLATAVVAPTKNFAHRNSEASYAFLEKCGITVIILESYLNR